MKKYILIVPGIAIALISACKNHSHYEVTSMDTVQADTPLDSTKASVKLVKTAELNFKVKDVQQAGEQVANLTSQYKGIVMHHEVQTMTLSNHDERLTNDSLMRVTAQSIQASMTVKVPAERLENFMNEAGKLGTSITLRKTDIEDKTFEYISSQLKLQNRNQLVQQQKKGRVIIKDPSAALQLKDDMIDEKVNSLIINNEVKYSTAELYFFQNNVINKEVIINDNPADYKLPFLSQLGLAFQNGWQVLKALVIWIVNCWAIVTAGLVFWLMIRLVYRRRIRIQHI